MKKSGKRHGLSLTLRLLMLLCVAGIIISATVLLYDQRQYSKAEDSYERLRNLSAAVSAEDETEISPEPEEAQADMAEGEGGRPQNQSDGSGETAETEEAPLERAPDFDILKEINPDTVAWIRAPESGIDYPVVRGSDNVRYLDRLFTGEKNKLGTIFVDYRNAGNFSDRNTAVYGHNMKDGSMFSSLIKYRGQSYYDSFPTMRLYTPDAEYTIEIFAGLVVDGRSEALELEFEDEAEFMDYISALKRESDFVAEIDIGPDDRILSLCTCSTEFYNARYILFGRLS